MRLIRELFIVGSIQLMSFVGFVQPQSDCVNDQLPITLDLVTHLLFMVPNEETIQIWRSSSGDQLAIPTKFTLPLDASQIILDPSGSKVAYVLLYNGQVASRRIMLLDLFTGQTEEILSSTVANIPQLIDLRWISETQLGFVSNAIEQAYTIVNIGEHSFQTRNANIPIPERDVRGGSSFGDWDIKFSQDFSHAVFIDFRTPAEPIEIWDVENSEKLDIENLPPVSWVGAARAYRWHPTEDIFWIRAGISDWFEIQITTHEILQITDAGSLGILQFPIIHSDTDRSVFQAVNDQQGQFVTSLMLLDDGILKSTCLEITIAVTFNAGTAGWSSEGDFYALAQIDHEREKSMILILDTTSLEFANIYESSSVLPQMEILGWVPSSES